MWNHIIYTLSHLNYFTQHNVFVIHPVRCLRGYSSCSFILISCISFHEYSQSVLFFILVDRLFGYFQCLTKTAVDILIQVVLVHMCFHFTCRSRFSLSWNMCIFESVRDWQTAFQSILTILYTHQQRLRVRDALLAVPVFEHFLFWF